MNTKEKKLTNEQAILIALRDAINLKLRETRTSRYSFDKEYVENSDYALTVALRNFLWSSRLHYVIRERTLYEPTHFYE
jgi:hypothetical protein